MTKLTQKEWNEVLKEHKKAYQNDLKKYSLEIDNLKRELSDEIKVSKKLNKNLEEAYFFIQSIKDKLARFELK